MNISEGTRNSFVRDFDLPIPVVTDPYFEYYIDLFDKQYESKLKLKFLTDAIEAFGNEDKFHKEVHERIEFVIGHIKNNTAYIKFTTEDLNRFGVVSPLNKGNLYIEENKDKYFASIDLKSANYQSLKFFDPLIVDDLADYESYISRFFSAYYMIASKKIRQVIFGNLCPNRQQTIQKHIMSLIKDYLIKSGIPDNKIKSASSDELIIEIENFDDNCIAGLMINREILEDIYFSVKMFKLEKKGTDKFSFFVKTPKYGKMEIKGVNSNYMPEVIRFLNGEQPTDFDRLFVQDGRYARYITPLF